MLQITSCQISLRYWGFFMPLIHCWFNTFFRRLGAVLLWDVLRSKRHHQHQEIITVFAYSHSLQSLNRARGGVQRPESAESSGSGSANKQWKDTKGTMYPKDIGWYPIPDQWGAAECVSYTCVPLKGDGRDYHKNGELQCVQENMVVLRAWITWPSW